METDVLKVLLCHLQHVARVGEEHVAPVAVLGHVLVFALLEKFELRRVVAFNPAGLVKVDRLPAALGVVFVLKAILYHLKLQLAYGADNLAAVELIDKQLRHAFVHQLLDAFVELLRLHRVGVFDVFEHLGRERRQAPEMNQLALGERVADFERAVVGQAHDVARPSLVDGALALCHKLCGGREAERLALAHVQIGRVAAETARADLAESDAGAVVGVDIGCNLEDKACELFFLGTHLALLGLSGARVGGNLHKAVEQFLHAEVVERRTEEHGRNLGIEIIFYVERRINAVDEFKVFAQFCCVLLAHARFQFLTVDIDGHVLRDFLLVGREEVEILLIYIIYALKPCALVDGPRERAHGDLQLLLQLVEEVEGVAPLSVELIDEHDDRRLAHTAHRHQLARLRFHALRSVHHDDGGIDGRERAKGVLGKVLVARRVENIDFISVVVELHHGGRYRDAALLFDFHPVAGRGLLNFVVLYGACHLDLPAEEQQLFGQRGLTGVGVRDNGKGAAAFYFLVHWRGDIRKRFFLQ